MSVTALRASHDSVIAPERNWIYNRRWDLLFISFSVILVPVPYLIWI